MPAMSLALQLRLGFDQARVDAGGHRHGVVAVLPDLLQEERREAVFGDELLARAGHDRHARVVEREERNRVGDGNVLPWYVIDAVADRDARRRSC